MEEFLWSFYKLQRAASCSQPSFLTVSAFGHCESGPSMGLEKQLDSLTSLKVKWEVSDKKVAHVEEDKGNELSEGSSL